MPLTSLKSPRDFLRIWFFWKVHALFLLCFIVFIVMFYAYTCTPQYESVAGIVLLPKTNQDLVITAGADQKQVIRPVSEEDINTEIDLILSEKVIADTVRSFKNGATGLKLEDKSLPDIVFSFFSDTIDIILVFTGLKPEPPSRFDCQVQLLRNSLTIEPVYNSNIIVVKLRGERPGSTAKVLNKLLHTYLQYHNDVFHLEKGVQFYDDQVEVYSQRLAAAKQRLMAFQKDWSIVNLDQQIQSSIDLLIQLTENLKLLEIEYDEAKGRITMLRGSQAAKNNDAIITREMRTLPAIVELEKGIVPLLIKRSEISKTFTTTSREYRDLNDQIELLRGEMKNEIRRAVMTDELELQSLAIKKESLQKKIYEIQEQTSNLNQKKELLRNLQTQVDINRKNYVLYSSKKENARIYSEQKNRNIANVTIAQKASMPGGPVYPDRLLFLGVSIFMGIFAALGLPFILEALDRRLKTIDAVQEYLSLPVICSFPEIKNK